jgi:hypothetical protein
MIKLLASTRKWWATFQKRPYVEVISEGHLTKDGYPLELDWNSYFIEELDRYGIEGNSDEDMVEVWLLQLARAAHQNKVTEAAIRAEERLQQEQEAIDS